MQHILQVGCSFCHPTNSVKSLTSMTSCRKIYYIEADQQMKSAAIDSLRSLDTDNKRTHTCSISMVIFPGEPRLAGCYLNSPSPFIPELHILLGQAYTFHVILNTIHQVFFGRPLCLIPSTSHVIQCLTQSLSSFRSTCPNHLNLLFLIIKLTGSNP